MSLLTDEKNRLTKQAIQAAGGWVRDDGTIVFKDMDTFNKVMEAQFAERPSAYELTATKYANGRQLVYAIPKALASYIKATPLYARS